MTHSSLWFCRCVGGGSNQQVFWIGEQKRNDDAATAGNLLRAALRTTTEMEATCTPEPRWVSIPRWTGQVSAGAVSPDHPVLSVPRRRGEFIGRHGDHTRRLDELMARVAAGDRSAFDDLYDLISGPVFGTAVKIARNRAIAEEIAHDVLTEVWRKSTDWQPERGSAATWILTITRRRAIDRVRREQASFDRTMRVGASSGDRDYDDVSETVIERSEQAEVTGLLDSLSELQREAIGLAFYDGRTQREIAQLLGIPLGTVKTRIRDGLGALRRQMGSAT